MPLVTILLLGGSGYAHCRFCSPLAFGPSVSIASSTSWKAPKAATEDTYPPYNIERSGEDQFQISLALAGFGPDDIAITAEQNVLTVEGAKKVSNDQRELLYRGISNRPFKRQFSLADYVQVRGATFGQRPAEDRVGA